MPPYANQNFYNPNPYMNNFNQQSMQNQYMDRLNQLQQYQQNLQPQMANANQPQQIGLNCRVVDDFNTIVANDVPMDGNGAIFMKRDGSEIQWRNWESNGTIITTPYKPILDQNITEQSNIPQMDFTGLNEDVRALREDIKDMRSMIEKSISKPTANKGKKIEVNADE